MKTLGTILWRFMVIFSFLVNIILVIVLLVLGLLIFEIKNQIAQPLIGGLTSTAAGLGNATIDWTIPVRDTITVNDTIRVDDAIAVNDSIDLVRCTTVRLNAEVPLNVNANITLPGVGNLNNANVELNLPEGLPLPICLDLQDIPVNLPRVPVQLDVPIALQVPVDLNVRAVIPLNQTQLRDPILNLQYLFQPLAVGLNNLPNNFGEAGSMISSTLSGNAPDLLADNGYIQSVWPGYSLTAGYNYPPELAGQPFPPSNVPLLTGINPIGGIPALDAQLRPELYLNGQTPASMNATAMQTMQARGVNAWYYNGTYSLYQQGAQSSQAALQQNAGGQPTTPTTGGQPTPPTTGSVDTSGQIPLPTTGGTDTSGIPPTTGGTDTSGQIPPPNTGGAPTPPPTLVPSGADAGILPTPAP
jgi:hypothetical protein